MSDVDDKEPEEVQEGMVRRTRKVRKKRKSERSASESKDHADTLFAKAKDLLVGMEDENDDHGHVDVAEQVRRLKKKKEDDRPLDDVWGTKKKSTAWLWIVLAGLIISVVAIVIGVTMWISDEPRADKGKDGIKPPVGTLTEVDLSEGPLGWFNEHSIEVLASAKELIHLANKSDDPASLAEIVRDSPFRKLNPLQPEHWGSDYLTNATSKFTWTPKIVNASEGANEAKRGYLMVSGTRIDGNPFEAYFVEQENKVVLDWDATMGWSEMSVPDIASKKPRKEIFLRCRVTKKSSYDDQEFGNVSYSGYVISGESSDEFFLAYVPLNIERGKVIDRDLKLLLNYGSFVTDNPPLQNQKVTLRVRYGDDSGKKKIFEIVEFLHDGWVSP